MKTYAVPLRVRLGLLLLLSTAPALAQITFTSSRLDLGPDLVNWGNSGVEYINLANGFAATSVGGIGLKVFGSTSDFIRLDEGSGWLGNFAAGDAVLYTDWQPATVDIVFNSVLRGAGAQIQSELLGGFTATLDVYGISGLLVSNTFSGTSNAAGDGSAIFVGAYSASAEIKRIVFSIDDGEGQLGFGINDLQVRGAPPPNPPGVPDGRPYGEVLLLALIAVSAYRQRAQAAARAQTTSPDR